MKPSFSNKLQKENRGYHSSIAVVLFVVFVTVTVSLFVLAIKGAFKANKEESTTVDTNKTIPGEIEEVKIESQIKEETTYTVDSGDTLYSIGIKFGIDWEKIAEVNNLEKPYTLSTGQELKIPKNNNGNN